MNVVWFFLTVIVGVAFFLLRRQIRWLYGVIEIIVALLVIFFSFFPVANTLTDEGSYGFGSSIYLTSAIVGRLTGVYILVRGLDNVEAGLSRSCWLYVWWKHIVVSRWPCLELFLRRVARLIECK